MIEPRDVVAGILFGIVFFRLGTLEGRVKVLWKWWGSDGAELTGIKNALAGAAKNIRSAMSADQEERDDLQ